MEGGLLIDKPEGWTSHDVVARMRTILRTRRIGHTGTLDPFATGLLVLCIGETTRLIQFLVGLEKTYVATIRLGYATDTQDRTGEQITPTRTSNELSEQMVKQALNEFLGPQLQTPPMYSAKKVSGRRLHELARRGIEVEREPVPVNVQSIEWLDSGEGGLRARPDGVVDFDVLVRVSAGTYIRTLANDIGEKLGVGGHLAALRRLSMGAFDVSGAPGPEEVSRRIDEGCFGVELISNSDLLAHLRCRSLNAGEARLVANGVPIEAGMPVKGSGEQVRLCVGDELAAVGVLDCSSDTLRPRVVLSAARRVGKASRGELSWRG